MPHHPGSGFRPWLLLLCCFVLAGGDPPKAPPRFQGPLPPSVWAMAGEPGLAEAGAVVLEDRWRIGHEVGLVERTYRVRILSQAGRQALEMQKLMGKLAAFEGRVAYPDGTFLALDGAQDLTEKTLLAVGGFEFKRTILVPPGLTSDCVVELYLAIKLFSPDPAFPLFEDVWLGNAFATRELVLDLGNRLGFGVLLALAPGARQETVKSDGRLVTTLMDVPALVPVPFQSGAALERSRIFLYTPQLGISADAGPDLRTFWSEVGREVLQDDYRTDDTGELRWVIQDGQYTHQYLKKKGPAYEGLSRELLADLPAAPQAKARELYLRLAGKIQRWSHLSRAEALALRARKIDPDRLEPHAYERAITLGGTSSKGWLNLYVRLLRDAGTNPSLLMVVPASRRAFFPNLRTTTQFSWTLVRVDEAGKPPLVLDADLRFGEPGDMTGAYQGTRCLAVDTATWLPSMTEVSWQAPERSQATYTFRLEPRGAAMAIEAGAEFVGPWARMAFLGPDANGRAVQLLDGLEGSARDLDLRWDEAEVPDPADLGSPFHWKARGRIRQGTGDHLRVAPSPGLPPMLPVEELLPARREDPIYLGPPQLRRVRATIRVPVGYAWKGQGSFSRANALGSVRWEATASRDAQEVEVRVETVLKTGIAPASEYGECRRFLAWLKETGDRVVELERIP